MIIYTDGSDHPNPGPGGFGVVVCDNNNNIQLISNGKHSVSLRYYNNDLDNYLIYGRRNHSIATNLDVRDDYNELNNE